MALIIQINNCITFLIGTMIHEIIRLPSILLVNKVHTMFIINRFDKELFRRLYDAL